MSKAKHTKGQLTIYGHCTRSNPSCVLATAEKFLFQTVGDNDEANAERLVLCWNAHDALTADLKKYGGHTKSCPVSWNSGGLKCTCGWDARKKEIEQAPKGEKP